MNEWAIPSKPVLMWEIFLGRFEASLAKHMASSKVGKNRTVPPEEIAKWVGTSVQETDEAAGNMG